MIIFPTAKGFLKVSSAAAGWTPASLSGLTVWLDSQDSGSITHSSGAVSQWNDKSGNSNHFTQATGIRQPSYASSGGPNGKAYVLFNGDNMTSPSINLGSRSVFIVAAKNGSPAAGYHALLYQTTTPYNQIYMSAADAVNTFIGSSTATWSGTSFNSTLSAYSFFSATGAQSYRRDNRALSSATTTVAFSSVNSAFNLGNALSNYCNAYINEVIIYDRVLNATEKAQVHEYLADKWTLAEYDTDALAFGDTLAAISGGTSALLDTPFSAVNTLVSSLKTYSIWSKAYAIYPIVGGSATQHSYNLKNTSNYQITWAGSPTHSATGVATNGTTAYGNTNLTPNGLITMADSSLGFYVSAGTAGDDYYDMGAGTSSTTGLLTCFARRATHAQWMGYDAGGASQRAARTTDPGTAGGWTSGASGSTTDRRVYRNGSLEGSNSTTNSNAAPNHPIFLGSFNQAGTATSGCARTYSMFWIGTNLTDTEQADLYTIVQAYQTALSRQL